VAAVCPRDGASRCTGTAGARDLSGWIWATEAQVLQLMGHYEPSMLTADPPSVSGPEYVLPAIVFVEDIRPTFFFSGYSATTGTVSGWTASERDGLPAVASAGYTHPVFNGSFGVAGAVDGASPYRGVWLWRPSTDDLTPPAITPSLSGTPGSNGWYVSDVAVSWTVTDPESAVSSTSGCEDATVTTDTAGTTFTCTATSGGGTSTASVVVQRDTVAPSVTCASPPQEFQIYQLGAWVSATVTDATAGPQRPVAQGPVMANTTLPGTFTQTVTGTDRAGNRTSVTCSYRVVIPTCRGLTPTIVGTALNNVINGTGAADVIVALGGADTVNAGGGDDVICGGDGPDTIYGGDGRDWIDGGASPDDLNGGNGDDFLDGGLHNDSLRGDGGRDTCVSGETRTSSCEA
jgi:Ca2+-binding RTX toxin-like protein